MMMSHAKAPDTSPSDSAHALAAGRLWADLSERWDQEQAEAFAEQIDLWLDASDGEQAGHLGDLAAYLSSFVENGREPNTAQRIRLSELCSLARVPAHLEPTPDQPAATDHPPAATETNKVTPIQAAATNRPNASRNTLCLLAIGDKQVPGLHSALTERGYEVESFSDMVGLRDFLTGTTPGAVLLLATQLRALPALAARWRDASTLPSVIVISPDRDLTHRLLAARAGAAAFFATPLDSYRIAARIDELLGRQEAPPFRVLIVEDDRELAVQCGQWIASEGMTARIAAHGSAAITALNDFQPDAVLIDATLPDARGIDLVQVMRQQSEHATLPIVMAADGGDATERFDAIAAGADEVLVKPLKARHVVGVIRSRVQRAQWLRAQAEAGAARDPKTGLYSRSLVLDRIGSRIGTQGAALMMIQFDDSQQVSSRIGLSAMAAIDNDMGARLRTCLAHHDLACGLRDFTWLVLLTRDRREQISQLAERLRFAIVERPYSIGNDEIGVSASIGLVAIDDAPTDVDLAIQTAERACTDAKSRGGNLALWSAVDDQAPTDPLLAVRAILSRPLDRRNLRIEYRPLVPLKGNLHGQFDFQFFLGSASGDQSRGGYALCARVANELGVRAALEHARFEVALSAREEARGEHHALRFLMPVTSDWLQDQSEQDWLFNALAERQLAGGGFTFELTGAELLDHREALDAPIARLREAGFRFGISDYGRDFAAVHVLTQLPVDVLRLDAELLDATASANSTSPTLVALVRKAHQLGAMVVAPGMNTLEHAHIYTRLGIDYGVGNAFGPALSQPEFDFNRPLW